MSLEKRYYRKSIKIFSPNLDDLFLHPVLQVNISKYCFDPFQRHELEQWLLSR